MDSSQADRVREISDNNLIDNSFTTDASEYSDTPSVIAAFEADEQHHINLRRQAALAARARKLANQELAA